VTVALHPAIRAMLDRAQQAGIPALSAGTPADARAMMETARVALGDGVAAGSSTELTIPTRGGDITGTLLMRVA